MSKIYGKKKISSTASRTSSVVVVERYNGVNNQLAYFSEICSGFSRDFDIEILEAKKFKIGVQNLEPLKRIFE